MKSLIGLAAPYLKGFVAALCLVLFASQPVVAQGTYQSQDSFLDEVFESNVPEPQIVWLTGSLKQETSEILGHPYSKLRVRYWRDEQRTAWILDEIGKEKPITTGFVVSPDNRVEQVSVLVFRETRGWEVKYPFFTQQFMGVSLSKKNQLDKKIDSITGATLSVSAVTRLAKMALHLNQKTLKKIADDSLTDSKIRALAEKSGS